MLKYEKIALKIEEEIKSKNLQQGTKLPSIEELMSKYEVSKSTIVKSLSTLENRGIIFQVRGSGIFVRRKTRDGYVNLVLHNGLTKGLENLELSTKLIYLKKIIPDAEIASNLNCLEGEEVYAVKRIRYSDNQVMCLEEAYYKKSLVPYLNNEIASNSIFYYIETALGVKISFSDKYLTVDKLNEDNAFDLELPVGEPVICIDELYYTTTGETLNFSRVTYHYKHAKFFIQTM